MSSTDEEHREKIQLHKASKDAFNQLVTEKKKAYEEYRPAFCFVLLLLHKSVSFNKKYLSILLGTVENNWKVAKHSSIMKLNNFICMGFIA